VGANEIVHVNARVVATTNRDLAALVKEQKFRADLFYRLTVVTIRLPPLRERREDIPLLCEHFAARLAKGKWPPSRPRRCRDSRTRPTAPRRAGRTAAVRGKGRLITLGADALGSG
jgi:DNA-binding NtrC family response regulator